MSDKVFNVLEEKIEKTIARLHDELATVRAGRANAALVDRVTVDYYGVATPLKQLANISVPDPKTIAITPFDVSALKAMEHGINEANLGINPTNDGKVIRYCYPSTPIGINLPNANWIRAAGSGFVANLKSIRFS